MWTQFRTKISFDLSSCLLSTLNITSSSSLFWPNSKFFQSFYSLENVVILALNSDLGQNLLQEKFLGFFNCMECLFSNQVYIILFNLKDKISMRDTEKESLPLPTDIWWHILEEPSFIKLLWPSKHRAVNLHFLKDFQISSTLWIPVWLKKCSLSVGTVTGPFPGLKQWKNGRWS